MKLRIPSAVVINFSNIKLDKVIFLLTIKNVAENLLPIQNITQKVDIQIKDIPNEKITKKNNKIVIDYPVKKVTSSKIINKSTTHEENIYYSKRNKVLLFKNIVNRPKGLPIDRSISQATLYLASALRKNGIEVLLSDLYIDFEKDCFINLTSLEKILIENKDINLIGITLLEDYFEYVKKLLKLIREKSNAFIAVGGIMPTLTPEHVIVHLDEVNFVVRGEGEEILPQIVNIINNKNITTSLSVNDIEKIRDLKGVYFYKDDIFISANPQIINKVSNLDKSYIDFRLINKEDIQAGLNLTITRGCNNYCKFCTLPTKGHFRVKSVNEVMKILKNYEKRLIEIFEKKHKIPKYSYIIHFRDENLFSAYNIIEILNIFKNNKFKIGTVDFVNSVNSFFKNNSLNTELLSIITSKIFATNSEEVPVIQLSTDSFSDKELKYLNKGYTTKEVFTLIDELVKRGIIHSHHITLSNIYTNFNDIFQTIQQIIRLKLKYGKYFNIIEPKKKLCSYFSTPLFKQIFNKRELQYLTIKNIERIDNLEEFDYYFVKEDNPKDKLAKELVDNFEKIFDYNDHYIETLKNLVEFIHSKELNIKFSSEDLPKLINKFVEEKREYINKLKKENCINSAVVNFMEKDLRKVGISIEYFMRNSATLILVLTHNCSLKCIYCSCKNMEGKSMSREVLRRGLELLFKTNKKKIYLSFFGLEPLLEFELIKEAVNIAEDYKKLFNKDISYDLFTNGTHLTEEVINFIKNYDFQLRISLDGKKQTQILTRPSRDKKYNSYDLIVNRLPLVLSSGIQYKIVMTIAPNVVENLYDDFEHLTDLGIRKIEINFAMGLYWSEEKIKIFIKELDKIGEKFLFLKNNDIVLTNAINFDRRGMLLFNNDPTLDVTGDIYSGFVYLISPKMRRITQIGNCFSDKSIDYYEVNRIDYQFLKWNVLPKSILMSNLKVIQVLNSFIKKVIELKKECIYH